jgi:hypothetical protein
MRPGGDRLDRLAVEPKTRALHGGGRVVDVHDGARAPRSASKVRSISSSRACTSTCTVTSAGSVVRRSASAEIEIGLLAAGKPTSISLKPTLTSSLNSSPLLRHVHRAR